MSEFFLAKYRPVVDALLNAHGLTVADLTRDMLATTIAHNRELPATEPKPPGARSALPVLRVARTHARKLIEYADHPPTRKASVSLRCAKLVAAIRKHESRIRLELVLAGIDPNALLDILDAGSIDVANLRRLVQLTNAVESESGGIGRPWAAHTTVVRGGCIAWERAGRRVTCAWNVKSGKLNGKLTGALPAFLRDLIACCDGTHDLVKEKPRRIPAGYREPCSRSRQGDILRKRVPDHVLRDAIEAYRNWWKGHLPKN